MLFYLFGEFFISSKICIYLCKLYVQGRRNVSNFEKPAIRATFDSIFHLFPIFNVKFWGSIDPWVPMPPMYFDPMQWGTSTSTLCIPYCPWILSSLSKGQLISKRLSTIFTWTKKGTKNFYPEDMLLLWVRAPLKEVFFLFNLLF